MDNRQDIVEAFLKFAEGKGISLGGDVVYGFAMEHTDFRPMHKDDYAVLMRDFLAGEPVCEKCGGTHPSE